MRKRLIIFGMIFCLISVLNTDAQTRRLKRLGEAPLSSELINDPETAKRFVKDNFEEAVVLILVETNHTELIPVFQEKITEAKIVRGLVFPGEVMEGMAFKGKNGVAVLKDVEWDGKEPFEAFFLYLNYLGKSYEWVVPEKCGNIVLKRVFSIPEPEQIRPKPEPEPEPESRIVPFKPYPSRIEIKPKKNFSLRILYPIPMFSIEAPADILFSTSIEWYFGDWTCYTIDNDVVHLRTNSQLSYEQGVGVSLYESRESSKNQIGIPFGVELGLRLFGNIWALVNYSQSPFYQIRTKEEWNYLYFEEFQKIADGEYQMKLDRISLIQDTQERFFFQNFQLGIRGEIPVYQDITKILLGAGLDFLKVNRNFEKKIRESELAIWSDQILAEQVETSQTKDSKWFNRVFVLAGMMMDLRVVEGLGLGVQGKYYFPLREREVEFQKSYLLPADPDVWKITPPQYSVEVFISFSF